MKKRNVKHKYGIRSNGQGKSYKEIADLLGYSTPSGARYQYYTGLKKILDCFLEYQGMTNLTPKQKETVLRSQEFADLVKQAMLMKDDD